MELHILKRDKDWREFNDIHDIGASYMVQAPITHHLTLTLHTP